MTVRFKIERRTRWVIRVVGEQSETPWTDIGTERLDPFEDGMVTLGIEIHRLASKGEEVEVIAPAEALAPERDRIDAWVRGLIANGRHYGGLEP